jgi:hypothetical protein
VYNKFIFLIALHFFIHKNESMQIKFENYNTINLLLVAAVSFSTIIFLCIQISWKWMHATIVRMVSNFKRADIAMWKETCCFFLFLETGKSGCFVEGSNYTCYALYRLYRSRGFHLARSFFSLVCTLVSEVTLISLSNYIDFSTHIDTWRTSKNLLFRWFANVQTR